MRKIRMERMKVRINWSVAIGILLALSLLSFPVDTGALAASESGTSTGPVHDISTMDHSGHDMSAMDHSGHDMSTMNDVNPREGSPDSSHNGHGSAAGHGAGTGDNHNSGNASGENAHPNHGSGSGGHGESSQDPNAPPDWPAIYGFGALNLLVIGAAGLLKYKVF